MEMYIRHNEARRDRERMLSYMSGNVYKIKYSLVQKEAKSGHLVRVKLSCMSMKAYKL